MSGRSISVTPLGGWPTLSSPVLFQSSLPCGLIHRSVTVCRPTSDGDPLRWTTRCARGCTAGIEPTCNASKTPSTLSFPSCERLAASAKSAKETCIRLNIDDPFGRVYFSTHDVRRMTTSTTQADDVTPGSRPARPGVWLAEVGLLFMALIWGINFSVIKYGTTILPPLGYNAFRTMLAAASLTIIAIVWGGARPNRSDFLMLLVLGALGNGVYQTLFIEGLSRTRAGEAALVVGASPALMALFARMRGIERVDSRRAIGIGLSIFGVGLVVLGRATSGAATNDGSLF